MPLNPPSAIPGTRRWLLLDPPSEEGYIRRGLLREKAGTVAAFPNIDLILLSGSVREAGFWPVYIDAQIRGWTWERLGTELAAMGVGGMVSLLTYLREPAELARLGELKRRLGGVPVFAVCPLSTVLDPVRTRRLIDEHPWLDGLILNIAENNLAGLMRNPEAPGFNIVSHAALGAKEEEVHAEGAEGAERRPINPQSSVRNPQSAIPSIPPVRVNYDTGVHMPMPEHGIFMDGRYFLPQSKRGPVTCVQMSFGCPFRCEFCLDNQLYRKMRYRDVDDVVAEMTAIDRLGFREVYFRDITFGLNKAVCHEFLEKLAARRLNVRWLCTTRVDVTTPKLLRLMANAGCYGIEYGIESGLRHRREANGKPISDEQIRTVFANCRALGIETTALVILGFEDETENEIRATMRFIEDADPDYAAYNVLNALAGTPLERRARDQGFLNDEPGDTRFRASNLRHRYLTPQRLEALRSEAVRSFYRRPRTMMVRLARTRSLFELWKLMRLARLAR